MNEFEGIPDELVRKIEASRHRVIETIGKNMDLYGVTLSVGHLYGYMYFRNEPATLDEMSETMGMSKTSMSTGMRTLVDMKMIQKVWGRGSRKDLYEAEQDWHQTFIDYFAIRWRKSLEMNTNALKRSLKEIEALQREMSESDNEKLKRLLEIDAHKIREGIKYYRWLGRLIDTFESGEIFDLVPREE